MEAVAARQLSQFKLAVRGRRGSSPTKLSNEDEWWALGQHHGLATPLLDWSDSPYAALYFAFEEEAPSQSGQRAVWALSVSEIESLQSFARTSEGRRLGYKPPNLLKVIRPIQDENARLLAQAALFTRVPLGETVTTWVRSEYSRSAVAVLYRIQIPDAGRPQCLAALNRMNINRLSLFPDIAGACAYCNMQLDTPRERPSPRR
jgi:hypothetical protein